MGLFGKKQEDSGASSGGVPSQDPTKQCDFCAYFEEKFIYLRSLVALTVNSRVIQTFIEWSPDATDVPLGNGLRIQVLPSVDDLPKARKNQCAAFLAAESLLVVWDDDPTNVVERATAIENELMELVWRAGEAADTEQGSDPEKASPAVVETTIDLETGEAKKEHRPTNIISAIQVALTLILIMGMLGFGYKQIAFQLLVDKGWWRLAFLVMTPVLILLSLFFAQVIVTNLAQCFGPIRQMQTNSKFYSALLPQRITGELPHITVQCPVYKEGLNSVIAPTVRSLKQAISTYELQGGSANIFINDDGMQIIDDDERQARIDFYHDHGIGWTARPKHGEDGFLRRGKFKKASNMNYGLMLSNNVEERLAIVERDENWNSNDEAREYDRCLKEVLDENGRAWADGNIRVGDYILLVDSDTRVPTDCLLDAASEMEQSPELKTDHNSITFFTNLIYTAISYTVSNGDVAPFVGHNAILRWSAIQQVSYFDEDNYEKFWSESHVSEDFDMSLRLQVNGYIIRLATWAGDGFKEGVSLTVYDELARWEKYAYGCNELLFHPVRFWFIRGPFTPLFRRFLFSNIRFTSKVTVISYIGTYYAIGAAWIMTTANYFTIGWYNGYIDKYYMDSWRVWFAIVVVFTGLGNISLAVLRYRLGTHTFFSSLLENFKWILMLAIFLGGLSLHVSSALLAHMFEYNMQWGATSKEAEFSNFFIEVPRVLKKFRWSFAISMLGVVGMIILAVGPFVPVGWRITDFVAIFPMAIVWASHLLLPVVLNPALMTFTF
ncbi:glycosyl transferase family group 2-domain-containing protein [Paraphoma chrysanthemicola]|uniref:Glycosyl transferase family group 2-domain-containing protein n=1 Tax=Paraphoma chrysanthemicola TaxID=798071 RepID=A0A8K0W0T7_9PLEO|nr:glycosyl transferase family group 2-domain-containing protein [Paraphoma chrysanthemicola]